MRYILVAGKGFEPHDLRVMSPTSYQTALPRDIIITAPSSQRCRKPGLNRYVTFVTRDFKSRASANSAIPAFGADDIMSCPCCYISIPQKQRFVKGFSVFSLTFVRLKTIIFGGIRSVMSFVNLFYREQPLALTESLSTTLSPSTT